MNRHNDQSNLLMTSSPTATRYAYDTVPHFTLVRRESSNNSAANYTGLYRPHCHARSSAEWVLTIFTKTRIHRPSLLRSKAAQCTDMIKYSKTIHHTAYRHIHVIYSAIVPQPVRPKCRELNVVKHSCTKHGLFVGSAVRK